MRSSSVRYLLFVLGLCAMSAAPLRAQGPGSTGLEVLQMPAGARAVALAGAYTAARTDADAIFYNPASVVGLDRAAALSYQRHVLDISLGSVAGIARVGRVGIGAGFAFLDGGEIPEIVPDERFGGQRGRPTGATVAARESAARIAVGLPVLQERAYVGTAIGFALSELAGVTRAAPLLDLGVQARVRDGWVAGAALRNLGGSMSGGGADPAPLPSEARLGTAYEWKVAQELGVNIAGDVLYRLRERSAGFAGGLEAGLIPNLREGPGAVVRVGYIGDRDLDGAGSLQIGAGISLSGVSLDYAYQNLEHFGAAHRIGIRWQRVP